MNLALYHVIVRRFVILPASVVAPSSSSSHASDPLLPRLSLLRACRQLGDTRTRRAIIQRPSQADEKVVAGVEVQRRDGCQKGEDHARYEHDLQPSHAQHRAVMLSARAVG